MKENSSYKTTHEGQVSHHSMRELDLFMPETCLLCSLIKWSPSAHALGNFSAVQPTAMLQLHITLSFLAYN